MSASVAFLKKYSPFLLALVVGVLVAAPAWYFRFAEPGYQGLDLLATDGEPFYVAEVQEMYDGNFALGNIYLADEKNAPYVQQPLSPLLIAALGKLLHLSVTGVNLFTKFLFPFLLTLILYYFFVDLLKRKDLALLAALFIMMTPATLTFFNPSAWLPFLKGEFVQSDYKFLSYARPINPQVSSLFFFGYLLCLWRFLYTNPKKVYGWLATVLLGLSFYAYFFAFSLLFVFNGFLGLWYLLTKKWAEFKKLTLVTTGGLVIGIPYFLNTFRAAQSPFYSEMTHRFGTTESRQFIFSKVWWGALIATLALYRKQDLFKLFALVFLAATFLLTNQHMITGQTIPIPSHYHWYYIAPLAGVFLLAILYHYLEKYLSAKKVYLVGALLGLLFFWSGILFQRGSYQVHRPFNLANQQHGSTIDYLKTLPAEKTVLANNELSNLIPVYTSLNIYHLAGMGDFLMSQERLKHTYYVNLALKGISAKEAQKYFYDNREEAGAWIYSQTYHVKKDGCYGCMPDQQLDELIAGYQAFLLKDFKTELLKYPLDYIVWDKATEPTWAIERYFKNPMYTAGTISIYKIK